MFATVLLDGCLVNLGVMSSGRAVVGVAASAAVHHVVLCSPCRATLRVTGTALVLTAVADTPACGTFSLACSEEDENENDNSGIATMTAVELVVDTDALGPVAHFERALVDTIARKAASRTNNSSNNNTSSAATRNKAIRAEAAVPHRARHCAPALARWCPRLSAFRDSDSMMLCVVRAARSGTSNKQQQPQQQQRASTTRAAAAAISDDDDDEYGLNQEQQQQQQYKATAAVRGAFGRAASHAREWRRCAVSFSTVMRFFQRDKSTFCWETPSPGAQTVISLAKRR
jgi:hypothetical protein